MIFNQNKRILLNKTKYGINLNSNHKQEFPHKSRIFINLLFKAKFKHQIICLKINMLFFKVFNLLSKIFILNKFLIMLLISHCSNFNSKLLIRISKIMSNLNFNNNLLIKISKIVISLNINNNNLTKLFKITTSHNFNNKILVKLIKINKSHNFKICRINKNHKIYKSNHN